MTQILLGHFFKTHEKTRFYQLNRFSVHVMAEKTTFSRPLTSSLRLFRTDCLLFVAVYYTQSTIRVFKELG